MLHKPVLAPLNLVHRHIVELLPRLLLESCLLEFFNLLIMLLYETIYLLKFVLEA